MTPCCKVRTTNISEVPATFTVKVNFTLKRQAAESSDTLVYIYQTTRHHVNHDRKLDIYLHQSLIGQQLFLPYDEKTNDR